ncbi:MAG: hypothetical protein SPL02_03055 [Bacilli bacterium]|nr:hypothetical protein [Bacilli bacterium]MDY6430876.1 hypothetical protein [Bacilli bacterium]
MIRISIYGLDQFVVGDYSGDHTANIANILEVEEDEIIFYAPNAMIFHKGIEQTSWNVIVSINAPIKFKPFEKLLTEYIFKTLSMFAIHIEIEFEYFEESSRYQQINKKYPRYIKKENITPIEEVDDSEEEFEEHHCEDEHCECGHHHDHEHEEESEIDINDEEQLYLGNAFEEFEDMLEEMDEKKN